jgi:16S rRNA (adenine1518-N6/adenine1519-N6)-dimethyltransferase
MRFVREYIEYMKNRFDDKQATFDQRSSRNRQMYNLPAKKKSFGQHFLRKQSVVDHMIERVAIDATTSVLEIGCGDGFLTTSILKKTACKQLWSYEIDNEWVSVVKKIITDSRFTVKNQDILTVDMMELAPHKPWVILANLPYQITFPILFLLQKNKDLFTEGVVMVQEEVAQKVVAQSGRGYGPTSLLLQRHFVWELLEKIEPSAFEPPPKVYSRLLYFKTIQTVSAIEKEEKFWLFVRSCFKHPRQTLRNNLKALYRSSIEKIPAEILNLRAQQMTFDQFLLLWAEMCNSEE